MWIKLAATAHPRHVTNSAVIGRCIFIPGGGNVTAAAAVIVPTMLSVYKNRWILWKKLREVGLIYR
jgi:hypothetical protein